MKYLDNKKGQTLVEVMLVASFLLIALMSAIYTYVYMSRSQVSEANQMIAAQLAREGVEMFRNMRDSNWLDPEAEWDNGFYSISPVGGYSETATINWSPQSNNNIILDFGINQIEDAPIYIHDDYWNHEFSVDFSGFYRLLTITPFCDGETFPPSNICLSSQIDAYKVVSTVGWQEKGIDKTYEIVDYFYDWK